EVTPTEPGMWHFRVEAWGDPIAHWRHVAQIKIPRGQDVELMFIEGARLFERAAEQMPAHERPPVSRLARDLADPTIPRRERLEAALAPDISDLLLRYPLRELVTTTE